MISRVVVVLMIASLVAGCNVGPKYLRPGVNAPPVYRADPSNPPGPQSLADEKWFELFKDKELQNLIHAAFVDGKEPQAELNQAPEHVPETVKVPWQNLSLIAKSNQDPEHIKCVLHQDPKLMICSLILTLAKN